MEYDQEQTDLETKITDLQHQLETISEEAIKVDNFLDLSKRYTKFDELTTPMLNEFIHKIIIHEKEGVGNNRTQQIDIKFNFIGDFHVPVDFVSDVDRVELQILSDKEQRRRELEEASYQRNKAKALERARERTRRYNAGELSKAELAKYEKNRAKRQAYNQVYHEKRRANKPPKPPQPTSMSEIYQKKREGIPLTSDEQAKYAEYRERKNKESNVRYHKIRAEKLALKNSTITTTSLAQVGN